MICVSIGRSRHRHMMAEHRHLVEQGATMVELRLDYIRGDVNIKRLLADRPCPVLITCRRESDGGKYTGPEQERQMLLRTAIAEGVEYVDLEEDIAGSIPRFGKTKRIVSLHDFRKTPDDLEAIHRRLCELDADIVKICTMANHPHDNLRMLRLVRQSKVPTVGLCMGDIGVPTRILSGKFGAPFTYATFHHERALAPGQLSFDQMINVYRYDQIDAATEVYGVIADPIGHSLSPLIHNAAFAERKLNKVYVPIRVPREDLAPFIDDATELGIKGLSVTIPHKEAMLPKLTKADGAVRGHRRVQHRRLRRQRTARLQHRLPRGDGRASKTPWAESRTAKTRSPAKTALVLGAGGVGKAIVYGLMRREAHVVVDRRPPASGRGPGQTLRLPHRRMGQAAHARARRAGQLHARGHAPQRGRNALRQAPPASDDGRLRRGVQSRNRRC